MCSVTYCFCSRIYFKRFYSGSSACDITSLFALRNMVNWRNVVSDPHNRPDQYKRFINLVVDADIIAAAMHFFGMESRDVFLQSIHLMNQIVSY